VKRPDRLYQEIDIMKSLDHPNIIKLYETFQDHRSIYLVMELCDGGELFDRIVAAGNFTEVQAAVLMQQAFRPIYYMHQQGITHRDIKPENFILSSKESIEVANLKLIDFGLSCKFTSGKSLTTKAGTPYYVAPQVLSGDYNELADVWSCGVVMYVLLCGYPPFHGETDATVLARVKAGVYKFPEAEWANISEDAKDLIKHCLEKDVNLRFSAEAAVNHVWITDTAPKASDCDIGSSGIVERLKDFRGQNKLKKAALHVIASQLSDGQIKELRATFNQLDANNDGTLTLQELKDGLEKCCGLEEIPADLMQIVQAVDENGSGQIDYTEFLTATISKKTYEREEVVWAAFRTFDIDGDGKITFEELQTILEDGSLAGHVDSENIAEMIRDADIDGDGSIDYNEFMNVILKTT